LLYRSSREPTRTNEEDLAMRFHTLGLILAASVAVSTANVAVADDSMPDPWITTKVKISLLTAKDVHAMDVNVDTTDGRVTLHGSVPSAAEKARATELTKSIDGVREVRNLVQVVAPGDEKAMEVADEALMEQVKEALAKDPALEDSDISVRSVNDGVVLLGGKAKTMSDHLRAIDDAVRVPGVVNVASEIESPGRLADNEIWREGSPDALQPAQSNVRDAWLTTAAKVRLLANPSTPALDVNVDTRDSVMTLFGSVENAEQKQLVESEVKKVDGVREVRNELQVVPEARHDVVTAKDDEIRKEIGDRFEARKQLDDADLDIEVSDGVARLSGTVESQVDRLAALTIARGVPGVRSVIGDLRIEGDARPEVSAR